MFITVYQLYLFRVVHFPANHNTNPQPTTSTITTAKTASAIQLARSDRIKNAPTIHDSPRSH